MVNIISWLVRCRWDWQQVISLPFLITLVPMLSLMIWITMSWCTPHLLLQYLVSWLTPVYSKNWSHMRLASMYCFMLKFLHPCPHLSQVKAPVPAPEASGGPSVSSHEDTGSPSVSLCEDTGSSSVPCGEGTDLPSEVQPHMPSPQSQVKAPVPAPEASGGPSVSSHEDTGGPSVSSCEGTGSSSASCGEGTGLPSKVQPHMPSPQSG